MPAKKKAEPAKPAAKAPAKKVAKKAAVKAPATKAPAKKAAKKAAKAPAKKVTKKAAASHDDIRKLAQEIYDHRVANGLPGTQDGDWNEAIRRLTSGK